MDTAIEQELKFDAGSLDLDRLGGDPLEPHVFSSTYHDTADRRLLRAGLTLRRRTENGSSVWQLKVPCGDERLEVEEPGGPAAVPSSLAAVLSGVLRGRETEPLATLVTRRHGQNLQGVDVTFDEVSVMDGNSVVQQFSEVEAEAVAGQPDAAEKMGRRLEQFGATRKTTGAKLLHIVDLPERSVPGRKAPSPEHLKAMLAAQLDELSRHDPVIRVSHDREAVHKMRVAVRRLRSVLRTARPILDRTWVESLRDELDWLGGTIGAVRDLDVLLTTLSAQTQEFGDGDAGRGERLLRPLEQERRSALEALRAAMHETRYYELLDGVEAAAGAPPIRRMDVPVEELARREFRRLKKHRPRGSSMSDRELHKLRIRGKRARYAAELAERTRGGKASRFIAAAKELQDILGDHQDAVVAADRLRALARSSERRGDAVVAGRLIELGERHKQRARRELRDAWKRVRRRGRSAWRS